MGTYSHHDFDGLPSTLILSLRFQFLALLLVCTAGVQADTRSIIVDDAATNLISYSKGWNIGDQCVGCAAQPDKSKARDGTWHDGTESPDRLDEVFFTFVFTGTSVEVRHTAIDLIGPWTTNTNVSYSIDGITRGEKQRKSTNQTDYLYNQLLFQIDGLLNVEHVLRVDVQMPGVLLFDYLIYTEETIDGNPTTNQVRSTSFFSTPTSSSPDFSSGVKDVNIGAVVGGVLSGIVVLVVASTSYYCFKHRRKRVQAHLSPLPEVTQVPPLYQPRTPAKLAGLSPYNPPHDGLSGANSPIPSQHILPFYHNIHSRSAVPPTVPSGTLTTTLGTSQGPSISESVLHPPAPLRQGNLHSSGDMNQPISSSVDEPAEHGLASRPLSLPPPYTPNPV